MKVRTEDCKVTPWGLQAAIALQIRVKVRLRVLKRWFYVKIIVVCLVCKVCCKRTPHIPSNQVLNSLRVVRIFTQNPYLPGERRVHEWGQGKRHL